MYRLLKNKPIQYIDSSESEDDAVHKDNNAEIPTATRPEEDTVQPSDDGTESLLRNNDGTGNGSTATGMSGTNGETPSTSAGGLKLSLFGLGDGLLLTVDQRNHYLASRLHSTVSKRTRTSKYLSAVTWRRDDKFHQQLLELVKTRATTVLFKWLTIHDDHYHIVHDCTFSNGSCRCFSKFKFERRNRRIVETQRLSYEDFYFIVKYHFGGKRRVEILEIGGHDYTRFFRGPKSIQSEVDPTGEAQYAGDVEVCSSESEILWAKHCGHEYIQSNGEVSSGYAESSSTTESTSRKRRAPNQEKENRQEKLEKLIIKICKVPIHDFVTTDLFINSNWRFYNNLSTTFKNAVSTVKLKFLNMRLCDYKHFYEQMEELPHWDTNNREEFVDKYLNLELSKRILLKLLIWQYAYSSIDMNTYKVLDNDWKSPVYKYVKELIMLLDKKRHKQNTDVYLSPPNAGKTLFCDMLRDYFINCGQMSHWNRNSSFPLQTCGFTRLIFWNEPNYETSVERNLLKLLGGDSYNAAIKNQMDVNISKTPFIVTSNNDPFPHKPEFEFRCSYHYWKAAPLLKIINGKKFHPLAFQFLVDECENYYEEDITGYHEKYSTTSADNKIDNTFFTTLGINNQVLFTDNEDSDTSDNEEL